MEKENANYFIARPSLPNDDWSRHRNTTGRLDTIIEIFYGRGLRLTQPKTRG